MAESTKMEFRYRRISQLADFGELTEMLFPGNRNQQYTAACIIFELKWTDTLAGAMISLLYDFGTMRSGFSIRVV